jgi:prepilin-type N-terminal cleavage/methylation domain-containing protein
MKVNPPDQRTPNRGVTKRAASERRGLSLQVLRQRVLGRRILRRKKGQAGFTLLELLIILAVFAVVLGMGWPALHRMIIRSKLQGFTNNLSITLGRARFEAIRSGEGEGAGRTVVVAITATEVFGYIDANLADFSAGSDLIYNPPAAPRPRQDDTTLVRFPMPVGLRLEAPPTQDAIKDFTVGPGGRVAVFEPDGSIRDTGAFRITDGRGNFLEIVVEPAATARVRLRKWDGSRWLESTETWEWDV